MAPRRRRSRRSCTTPPRTRAAKRRWPKSSTGSATDVADVVGECSDTVITPKPPWRQRKENYIEHLDNASDDTILVSMADKLDNARAILRDSAITVRRVWKRFSTDDPQEHLWYYRSLLEVYRHRSESWLIDELERVIHALEDEVGPPTAGEADAHF